MEIHFSSSEAHTVEKGKYQNWIWLELSAEQRSEILRRTGKEGEVVLMTLQEVVSHHFVAPEVASEPAEL